MNYCVVVLLGLLAGMSHADTIPQASLKDPRIGIVDYTPHDVYTIGVARGTVTRIILGLGESIVKGGTGFPANCTTPSEWCIEAASGSDQIWVKPLTGATINNLELQTSRGDYSFRFVVVDSAEKAIGVFYRVIFRHPLVLPSTTQLALPPAPPTVIPVAAQEPISRQASGTRSQDLVLRPKVRNYNYSKRHLPDAADLAPSVIFDDGRFTYLRFEKSQEVPSVFAYSADGSEGRVAVHSERLSGDPAMPDAMVEHDYLVVQRVARRFVLRLGAAVIEILNNGFDAKGIETHNGTTSEDLIREDKRDGK